MPETLPMTTQHCTVERDGHVVIFTMNRPEARNALSPDMLVGLADGFTYVDETPGDPLRDPHRRRRPLLARARTSRR